MFATLCQRNYALLWIGQFISMVGDWVLISALPFYVYNRTGQALASSGVFIALILPSLLFGSLAGVFVDRWDRRRTMLAADLLRAVVLIPLLLVHSTASIWIVFAGAFVESTISQFFGPAKSALIPRLVTPDRLATANTLSTVNENMARLLGPSLGGLLIATQGLSSVVALDCVSYLVSFALILAIVLPATGSTTQLEATPCRMPQQPEASAALSLHTTEDGGNLTTSSYVSCVACESEAVAVASGAATGQGSLGLCSGETRGALPCTALRLTEDDPVEFVTAHAKPAETSATEVTPGRPDKGNILEELRAGLALVRKDALLVRIFIVSGLLMLAQGILNALLVPFVKQVLHGDGRELGWIMSVQGIGGLIGGLVIGRLVSLLSPQRLISLGAFAVGLLLLIMVNVPLLPLVLALVALAGIPSVAYAVSEQTLLQRSVADEFRGRVFGTFGMVLSLMMLLGMGGGGLLTAWFRTPPILNLACGLFLLGGLIALKMPHREEHGEP